MNNYESYVRADHRLLGWMILRRCWILNRFHVKGDGHTGYKHKRGNEYDKEPVQFGRTLYIPKP